MSLAAIIEVTIDGIAQGFLFALLGLAITLVFGLGQILNLALGSFAVIAVIAAATVHNMTPSVFAAATVGVLVVGLLGVAVDRTVLEKVYRTDEEERILLGVVVTLGLALALDGILYAYFPFNYSLSHGVPGQSIGGIGVHGSAITTILPSILLIGILFAYFKFTYLGMATRTLFQDETGALLVGVNPRRLRTIIFVMSAMVAAIAGVIYSFGTQVSPASGFELTIYAIIVSIVGGVRNVTGAVVAGLFLGLVAAYLSYFIGAYVANVALFAIAIVVLLVKSEVLA